MQYSTQIEHLFNTLSPSDQDVVQYIERNRQEAAFMSINELAARVHSSKSSISRLAQKLGYRGFSDMKYALQESLTSTAQIPQNLLEAFEQEILTSLSLAQQYNYAPLVQSIYSAQRLIVYGTGATQCLYNRQFAMDMTLSGKPVQVVEGHAEMQLLARTLSDQDLVIITSNSGQSETLREIMNILNTRNIPVCSVTGVRSSFLSTHAQFCLFYQVTPLPQKSCHSLYGLSLVLTCLYRKYMEFVLFDE